MDVQRPHGETALGERQRRTQGSDSCIRTQPMHGHSRTGAPPTTYPIYILDLSGTDRVVYPDDKQDISHTEFWEQTVAAIVAEYFRISLGPLKDLSYCQRRARIASNGAVYYGEPPNDALLRTIEAAVGQTGLTWVDDDHEKRLEMDVFEFQQLRMD